MNKYCLYLTCLFLAAACSPKGEKTLSGLYKDDFRAEVKGKTTDLYTLTNSKGMEVCITDYGARVLSVIVPDRKGVMRNVIVGFDRMSDYLAKPVSHGAVIGRYVNRISDATFELDGKRYDLDRNSGPHCIHGGSEGWRGQVYDVHYKDSSTLILTMDSPDGEMGFPGNIHAEVTYSVTEDNALDISYKAVTDKPTVLNMTNHSFFNLSGKPDHEIWDNILYIDADHYTPVDGKVPTGEIAHVSNDVLDFRTPRPVDGEYDINMVLNHPGDTAIIAASLYAPDTGIRMEVYTDQPGLQLYTRQSSICLETQLFPDSPNHPDFPSSVLRPGQVYHHRCIYRFGVGKMMQ